MTTPAPPPRYDWPDRRPLVIDIFAGLGGWAEGFLAEGYRVVGFDIERHRYPDGRGYPGELVLQDVLTLHGSQFRDAAVIVASPPCQAYSYRAMPWKRAKALPPPDNTLFEACFRIQREAIQSTGRECPECGGSGVHQRRVAYSEVVDEHCKACDGLGAIETRHVPLIVENVKGAQKWVGRAAWHYGSYYLWGDVPALMPPVGNRRMKFQADCGPRLWRDRDVPRLNDGESAVKVPGLNWSRSDKPGYRAQAFNTTAEKRIKNNGGSWFAVAHNTESGLGQNPVNGVKSTGGSWFTPDADGRTKQGHWRDSGCVTRRYNSRDSRRKLASALIAKIPFPLARHIAWWFKPQDWPDRQYELDREVAWEKREAELERKERTNE